MLEKFNEFTSKKKALRDKKKQIKAQLKKQLNDVDRQNLEIQKQQIAKKMSVFQAGSSNYS